MCFMCIFLMCLSKRRRRIIWFLRLRPPNDEEAIMKEIALAAFVLLAGGADVHAQGKMATPSFNAMPAAAEADTDAPIDDRGILELLVAHTKTT